MKKKILICPLDWGLGHATRCIPIIRKLIKNDFEVIIGADNLALNLLKKEFPNLLCIKFPTFYQIKYSKYLPFALKMALQLPKIIIGIWREHYFLKKIIKNHKINFIISDNRFGLWNKKIKSVFITHQILIKMPIYLKFLEYPVYRLNRFIIEKYNVCWIPDNKNFPYFSGDLSHKYKLPKNAKFIGILSRFSSEKKVFFLKKHQKFKKILIIISGVEPQRSILENILIQKFKNTNFKITLIQGKPDKNIFTQKNNFKFITHLDTKKMKNVIKKHDLVICRSGYSSIMDLIALNKKAIFIPTPQQTEQEYLAKFLMEQKLFYSISQEKLYS